MIGTVRQQLKNLSADNEFVSLVIDDRQHTRYAGMLWANGDRTCFSVQGQSFHLDDVSRVNGKTIYLW